MASKTKIYLSLIGVGLLALAVDRCYFGASAPASTKAGQPDAGDDESPADVNSAPRPKFVPKSAGPTKLTVPELHFPRNLPTYDPAHDLRDVFVRMDMEGSVSNIDPAGNGKTSKDSTVGPIGRDAFRASHRVDAVMVQESLKIAVVDGRWVRVGDTVDGCKLTRIEGDSVYFECHDGGTAISPTSKRTYSPG
jgi:hypothetical protein